MIDVAKRVDRMFGVSQSVAHTARDAKDITNMVSHLLNEKVTMELEQRETRIKFEDPSIAGCRGGHIDKYLKGEVDDEKTRQLSATQQHIGGGTGDAGNSWLQQATARNLVKHCWRQRVK